MNYNHDLNDCPSLMEWGLILSYWGLGLALPSRGGGSPDQPKKEGSPPSEGIANPQSKKKWITPTSTRYSCSVCWGKTTRTGQPNGSNPFRSRVLVFVSVLSLSVRLFVCPLQFSADAAHNSLPVWWVMGGGVVVWCCGVVVV